MKRFFLFFFLSVITFQILAQASRDSAIVLPVKPFLNREVVTRLAHAAEIEVKKNNWQMSISIVDDSGTLLYFSRLDGASNSSVDLSMAKALSAVNFKNDGKNFRESVDKGAQVILSIPGILALDGGYCLYYRNQLVGAIGVSGSSAANDGIVAKVAVDLLHKLSTLSK
jgi:glc operon protein GlcG